MAILNLWDHGIRSWNNASCYQNLPARNILFRRGAPAAEISFPFPPSLEQTHGTVDNDAENEVSLSENYTKMQRGFRRTLHGSQAHDFMCPRRLLPGIPFGRDDGWTFRQSTPSAWRRVWAPAEPNAGCIAEPAGVTEPDPQASKRPASGAKAHKPDSDTTLAPPAATGEDLRSAQPSSRRRCLCYRRSDSVR